MVKEFDYSVLYTGGNKVKMVIWDTAGHERFGCLTPGHYRGGQGAVLVYDISSRDSFQKVEDWLGQLDTYGTNQDIVKILVGNKCDKDLDRQVMKEEGIQF